MTPSVLCCGRFAREVSKLLMKFKYIHNFVGLESLILNFATCIVKNLQNSTFIRSLIAFIWPVSCQHSICSFIMVTPRIPQNLVHIERQKERKEII